jgi:cobalt-zinc-cadmium efflux system membrane fusion protein
LEERRNGDSSMSETICRTGRLLRACAAVLVTAALLTAPVLGEEEAGEHGEEGEKHGQVEPQKLERYGITFPEAGPGVIKHSLTLAGTLVPHENLVGEITPRFPGVVREVRKRLGDPVAAGETVAVVESNQSLQRYEVRSGLAGAVVRRDVTIGEFVGDTESIFEVADYGELFADLYVFPSDFGKVRLGHAVVVRFPERGWETTTSVSFLSPVTDPATQSRFVRAVVKNPEGNYQPGMFVTGDIVLEEVSVPVAVAVSALRTRRGEAIVFVAEGSRTEPREVQVGRKDGAFAEIVSGLAAGERYAAGNTYVLLAELEKGEAGDDD